MKEHVLSACRHALAPLVRLLVRHGITWREFADLAKEVFVDTARRDYGLQGRETNNSRIALLTGLSRREVAHVKDVLDGHEPTSEAPRSRIAQVLSGWHLDPDFLDEAGRPALLREDGPERSLAALLKRYAGDIPHGALLKEMRAVGLIEAEDGRFRVTARDYIRQSADPDIVRQAGVALHDHGVTLLHNLDAQRDSPSRFEAMATHPALDPRDAAAFADFIAASGRAFLEQADAWLAEHGIPDGSDHAARMVRAGVGVYLIHDERQGTPRS